MNSTPYITDDATLNISIPVQNYDIRQIENLKRIIAVATGVEESSVDIRLGPSKTQNELHQFFAKYVEVNGISRNLAYDKLAGEIGVSRDTLLRWFRDKVPTSGNKRKLESIAKLNTIMAEHN